MTVMQTIVTALAAGAVAALEATASQAIQDAYAGVKALIQRKYANVHVQELEQQPQSKAWRAVVEEELAATDVAEDDEVMRQVQRLLDLIANQAPVAAQVIGVDLAEIRDASINVSKVIAEGTGAVTGVKGRGISTAAPIEISNIRATQTPVLPKAANQAKIKILFLAATPHDNAPLRTAEEARTIDLALRQAEQRNFEIVTHGAVQVADLQPLLFRHLPQIVHFSGHGSESNAIILQDANGNSAPVKASALRDLFHLFKAKIRCVVLNACYTDEQALALAAVIDCVVGMNEAISDTAAQHFSVAFYGALGSGQSVKSAFAAGCNRIDLSNLDEKQKPVLKAERVDADKVYFVSTK